jgi:hypothetical protein
MIWNVDMSTLNWEVSNSQCCDPPVW